MALAIKISGLVKKYDTITALDSLDLEIQEGEMLGLIGPDGAGKTTAMRIMCGLLKPDAGTCMVGGLDVRKNIRAVRSIIGYMPQKFSLYPDLSVAENLRFFADLFLVKRDEREKRLVRLLEFSRLGPFSKRLADSLSGGMKQKLALSCTLIHTPRVLILDEPTRGVDPVSRREFWEILDELLISGVTILVSTPYMDEAARCTRVAFIHKGKLLAVSEPKNVPDLYQSTLIRIKCAHNVAAARVLESSEKFDEVQIFGDHVHISAKKNEKDIIGDASKVLRKADINFTEMKKVKAGIEDVFVGLLR